MNTLPLSFRSLVSLYPLNRFSNKRHMLTLAITVVLASVNAARADDHSQCQSHKGFSTMFEPGFEPPVIEDNGLIQPNFVLLSGPWPETAYSGVVEPGEPFTISYSFVPDGTMIPGRGDQEPAPSNLFATFDANFPGGRSAWQSVIHQVFARYGEMTNITFVNVPDDGAAFGISFPFGIPGQGEPGAVGARGDIRISMRPIGEGPLATNWAPTFGGDMIMDSLDVSLFANPTNNFRNMRNVLFHEIGHGLGLDHVLPQNATKLMEPVLNTDFDGPQEDDMRAIHFLYGDRYESNDDETEYKFLDLQLEHPSVAGTQTVVVEDLSIEREDSEDWYGFTVAGSINGLPGMAVRLEPVGTEYQFSADEDDAQLETIDAAAARDLKFEVYRRVTANPLQIQLISTIDFNAAGEAEYRPPAAYALGGLFYIRVFSEDGIDDVQRYRLTVSNEEITAPQAAPSMSLANGLQTVPSGSILDMPATEVGQNGGLTLTVSNNGEGVLEIEGFTMVGAAASDYSAFLPSQPIQPGGFGILSIGFAPTAAGFRAAQLNISTNDPAGDYELTLRATATEAQVGALTASVDGNTVANGESIDLGELEQGVEYQISVGLENVGNANMSVFNANFLNDDAGDFERLTTLPLPLDTGATGEIILSLVPTLEGATNATLRMFNNGVQSPYDVTFTYSVVAGEPFDDCNTNGIDDETELDSDGNGVIDDCEVVLPPVEEDPIVEGDPNDDDEIDNNDGIDENDGDEQDVIDNEDDGNVVDQNNENDVENDDDFDNDDDQQVENNDEDREEKRTGFCGAGSIGMLTLTMLGLSGTRVRRRRLVS
ncbi:MAG: hypothetical protein DHS20C16_34530 [Phycisphaerae bacterium]|nr:MAG: hypothetical protein DHS20C16_34530 [Phycisphaerae bacterium]